MRGCSNRCPCTILGDWTGVYSRIAFGQSAARDSGPRARPRPRFQPKEQKKREEKREDKLDVLILQRWRSVRAHRPGTCSTAAKIASASDTENSFLPPPLLTPHLSRRKKELLNIIFETFSPCMTSDFPSNSRLSLHVNTELQQQSTAAHHTFIFAIQISPKGLWCNFPTVSHLEAEPSFRFPSVRITITTSPSLAKAK